MIYVGANVYWLFGRLYDEGVLFVLGNVVVTNDFIFLN
jgi:hypothetical protein